MLLEITQVFFELSIILLKNEEIKSSSSIIIIFLCGGIFSWEKQLFTATTISGSLQGFTRNAETFQIVLQIRISSGLLSQERTIIGVAFKFASISRISLMNSCPEISGILRSVIMKSISFLCSLKILKASLGELEGST